MGCPITRRDFVGGTLAAAGGATLLQGLPGAIPAARAQGLTDAWTGPGGIGDYAKANGNTADVLNAAHAIRDGVYTDALQGVTDTDELYDLVVVGAGISGLAAAFLYRQQAGQSILWAGPAFVHPSRPAEEKRRNLRSVRPTSRGRALFGQLKVVAFLLPEGRHPTAISVRSRTPP